MTPFPDEMTIREKYKPAMEIQDQAEADAYFEACVEHGMRGSDRTRSQAERIERINLGYYAGYYDDETQRRVQALFHCLHPVLGPIDESSQLTPAEVLRMGAELGRRAENAP